jgi:hypothetical protein
MVCRKQAGRILENDPWLSSVIFHGNLEGKEIVLIKKRDVSLK